MKFKLNRVAATGLIAAMLTNATSCSVEDFERLIPHLVNTTMTQTPVTQTTEYAGPIWDKLSRDMIMTHNKLPFGYSQLEGYPIPIQFLKEEGLITEDIKDQLILTTETQATNRYWPFTSRAFVDKNSSDNAIYLLVQFANGQITENETNDDIYLITWLLKYNVTEHDCQSFINMEGDFRIRFFIQAMDELYAPEVISKSIVAPSTISLATYENFGSEKNKYPYIFISNVDYDKHIITFGAYNNGELRHIDLDIRTTHAWQGNLAEGYTEEQLEAKIRLKSKETPFGPCLTDFNVNGWRAKLSTEEAKLAFANADKVMEVEDIAINSSEAKYDLDDQLNIKFGF